MDDNEVRNLIADVFRKVEADIFIYSGPIDYGPACGFVDMVYKKQNKLNSAVFFLTTYGGDPHAGFRMMRCLRNVYNGDVSLGVVGPCKSAGTLIALGAKEILMGSTGELGPLDIQLTKKDEIIPNSSGLDIFGALGVITEVAFGTFETYFLDLVLNSGGSISAKTAAEIAGNLVIGLFRPVTAQIDPNRLGEIERASSIAHLYSRMFGSKFLKNGAMDRLVFGYPSHGFVIDINEANELLTNVKLIEGELAQIANVFWPILRHPATEPTSMDLARMLIGPRGEEDAPGPSVKGDGADHPEEAGSNQGNGQDIEKNASDDHPSGPPES